MSLALLSDVLARTTGLDAQALGPRALVDVLPAGVSPDDPSAVARLAAVLERDVAARRDLRAHLLVHETSFFRYAASFAAMVREVERRLAVGAAPVCVLSAACSTGQEPASLAMALLEAGVPLGRVTIHAFDVSETAVQRAREGVYGERELGSLTRERRARFLEPAQGGARLGAEVRDALTFAVADLLEDEIPGGPTPFDLILCRNVLIYLTPEARRRVLGRLGRLLVPDGVLYVGHAEVVALRAFGWAPCEPLDAYGVKRSAPATASPAATGVAVAAPPRALPPRRAARPAAPPPAVVPAHAAHPAPLLVRARRLAEEGRAEEALALLEGEPGSVTAGGLHLAAVLARALARPEAVERALTRALYLDPRHAPALRLAALVAREEGDEEKARRLEARAERAEAETPRSGDA